MTTAAGPEPAHDKGKAAVDLGFYIIPGQGTAGAPAADAPIGQDILARPIVTVQVITRIADVVPPELTGAAAVTAVPGEIGHIALGGGGAKVIQHTLGRTGPTPVAVILGLFGHVHRVPTAAAGFSRFKTDGKHQHKTNNNDADQCTFVPHGYFSLLNSRRLERVLDTISRSGSNISELWTSVPGLVTKESIPNEILADLSGANPRVS